MSRYRRQTRKVEMYIGIQVDDSRTWTTETVDIPLNTPEDQIPKRAAEVLTERLKSCNYAHLQVAFIGVLPDQMKHP